MRISKIDDDLLLDIKDSRELDVKFIDMLVYGSLDEDNDLKVINWSVATEV